MIRRIMMQTVSRLRLFLGTIVLVAMTGCTQSLNDYQGQPDKLDVKNYFDGKLMAWGIVSDRSGTVKRRFTATIDASWQGNTGVLDEVFQFDDGEQQTRVWQLTVDGDEISGTAGDVVGEASGSVVAYAMNWQYDLTIEVDGEEWVVGVNDWLYQIDDDVIINIGTLRKFGLEVGQVVLFMQKQR
ncbi:DUF3833 domain-containing protein [Neiella sp. HB171785]|uniref:DUF3833 domain-containing protein n=1 Tax=Neiella litorisoli TaxID=2771431 RepID=A0A8J6QF53_9GAMM|nr:DUF3833 domain-containing protein [Neiella litorisoli]MBD1388524.1 DUF3833 domain-containing protein [Neiella litorisoli]